MTSQTRALDEPIGFTVEGIVALAGGAPKVSKKLEISVQSVNKWGRRIPQVHARTVAIMAGLPLEIVRPDLVKGGAEQAAAHIKATGG